MGRGREPKGFEGEGVVTVPFHSRRFRQPFVHAYRPQGADYLHAPQI